MSRIRKAQFNRQRVRAWSVAALAVVIWVSAPASRARVTAAPIPTPPATCTFNQSTPEVVTLATTFGGILIDSACQYVYLSNTAQNRIEVFSLQTLSLEAPIAVGAAPMGLDTTPDGALLYVANSGEHTVSVVDLGTRTELRKIAVPFDPINQDTPYGIAIANNGRAILTTGPAGCGGTCGQVFGIQLSTDLVALRSDYLFLSGKASSQTRLRASSDRNVIGLVEGGSSAGNAIKYVAVTDSFVAKQLGEDIADVSLDLTGSRWLVTGSTSAYALDSALKMSGLVSVGNGAGAGAVHPTLGLAYRPFGTKVEVLNLDTYLKTAEIDLGASVSSANTGRANYIGRTDLSDDGSVLAVITNTGFSIVRPFALAPQKVNLIQNGRFESGMTDWTPIGQPAASYITAVTSAGVLQFNRLPGSSEASVSQPTGQTLPSGAPLEAQFGLGNSSSVPKAIRVVLADGDFSESKTCSFLVPPGTPLATYRMHAFTTEVWTDASIYFYADTPGADGGANLTDNVTLAYDSSATPANDCISPPPSTNSSCVLNAAAPGFIPLAGTLSAIRVDDVCRFVYALDRASNRVIVYSLADRMLMAPIPVGSQPADFDITSDGTMYVANSGGSNVSVVDLRQGVEVRKIPLWTIFDSGTTSIDRNNTATSIAIAGNGKVLVTTKDFCCSGPSDVQQIVVASDAVSRRSDFSFPFPGRLRASDDRSTVAVLGPSQSSGPLLLYRSGTDSFSTTVNLNVSVRDVAVDGAGTRTFATPSGKLTDGTPAITGTIAGLSGSGSGALHPTLGLAYHAATTAVSLYNLTTLSKVGQVPLGDSVSTATPNNGIGRMDLSPDGRVLAVITNGGFSVVEPFAAGPPDHLELARNGSFAIGASGWQTFALPDPGYFQGGVTDGVMEFNRLAPPPGQPTQATIFQNTGVPLPSGAPIRAQFDLGNSSSARKRISVLLVDADFSDISVCTFWLQPNTALATYRMSSHTTRPWVNASIYFYAATDGSDGGYNRLDNVSLSFDSSVVPDRTTCEDPTTPAATGDADGPDLLVNGDFVSGTSAAWTIFGTLTPQVSDGVFEFIRPTGAAPAGVILQPTGATVAAGEMFTATFDLGNSSAVRKRVTVLLHDLDFSDLSACTFWLEPGQALSPYSMRAFATKAWANATVSFYAATVGVDGWTRLDNSTLRRTPSAVITGSECVEPGGSNAAPPTAAVTNSAPQSATPPAAKTASSVAVSSAPAERGGRGHADVISRQVTGESVFEFNGAATVSVALLSRLTGDASTGQIQISLDGEHWDTIAVVDSADDGSRILIDLASWPGASVRLRFVLNKPSGDSTVKWLIQWAADASRGRER